MSRLNVLSLFSGIGGLEFGLERAGMATVGQVETDEYCRRVLAKHWPDVPRHKDVRTAADWWLSEERPAVDVICGGFPCQDISAAGRRAGIIDGERSSLWAYLAHTVRVLRPRYVLVENVSALLVRGLDVVTADLAEIGYDLRWDCIPAAAVGAPHRRDRWFGIACPHADGIGRGPQRQGLNGGLGPTRLGEKRSGPPAQPSYTSRSGEHHVTEGSDPTQIRTFADSSDPADGRGLAAGDRLNRVGAPIVAPTVADAAGPRRARPVVAESTRRSIPLGSRQALPRGFGQPRRVAWWDVEPDVGRVASRLSPGMDGDLNAHPSCVTQARTAGLPATRRLRALRDYLESPAAPPEPARCNLCGHPLSTLPCSGACSPWYLGGWREEAEDLRCMREGVLGLLARQGEDLLPFLPSRDGPTQRAETLGSRSDRLRALGNAVVPQVAEYVGRLIVAHAGTVTA